MIAAPLYVITTTTLDRDEGLKCLTSAVDAIRTSIKKYGGDFNEKAAVSFMGKGYKFLFVFLSRDADTIQVCACIGRFTLYP